MSLHTLNIQRFRGVTDLSLNDLCPVNLIVGANNAGKSSVLEATSLLLRPQDPAHWLQTSRHRDETISPIDCIWSLFPNSSALSAESGLAETDQMKISAVIDGGSRSLSAQAFVRRVWPDDEHGVAQELVLTVDTTIVDDGRRLRHSIEFRRDSRAQPGQAQTFRCFTITPGGHRSTRTLVDFISEAVEAGQKEDAVELIRLFDPEIEAIDITFSYGRAGVRVRHRTLGVVELASFGDGLRRAALFGFALRRASGGYLLIDEIEGGIHTALLGSVLRALVEGARKAGVQILATTHSLEAVDAVVDATQADPSMMAIYHMRRDTDKKLEAVRFDSAQSANIRSMGVDVR